LKLILGDAKVLSDTVVAEIEADATRFADARRTLIEAVAPVAVSHNVPDEPITVTLSRNGWIRSRQGYALDASQFAWKAGDVPLAILETRTVSPVVMLDTQGRAYTVRAAEIPGGRGDGVPVTTLIELQPGAKVVAAICGAPEQKYLVAGSGGYGFVATLDDMVSKQRAGRAFMTLGADEEPIAPVTLVAGLDHVAALSSRGRLLVFPLAEMREVPRGRGVIIMGLDGEETLMTVGLATARKVILQGTNRLGRAIEVALEGEALARHLLRRARKGRAVTQKIRITGFGREIT
jgi:topoisomerase-4 subunit A